MTRTAAVVAAALVAGAAAFVIQVQRTAVPAGAARPGAGTTSGAASGAAAPRPITETIAATPAAARGGRLDFLRPQPIGDGVAAPDRPMIANVAVVDLDADGLSDVVAADAATNRVTWVRQAPAGRFTERALAEVPGPAHVHAADLDRDGDLDLAVASLGVLFPNNARIGAVILLENDGRQRFTPHVVLREVPRVADVRSGDLDGDGDLDLSVALFGYDQGETRWLRNDGGWRFASTTLQELSGPINAEIADVDGDRDLDIVTLVSQEWEEIYVHVNDGRGGFTPRRIFGASNEDFGSSWISLGDLDGDGDADVVYSNGDAFDYQTTTGRSWNGLQWLEHTGGGSFAYHRIADIPGASSPQAADLDGDGDLDIAVVSAYNNWADPKAQSLLWLENDGRARFTLRDVASAPTHLVTLAIGDVTGDGRPDLVTGGMHMSGPYDRLSRLTLWINQWPAAPR
ncbi:MAG: FG-GAP repeat domain-containing protein [Vicinamibacterales bacterium]